MIAWYSRARSSLRSATSCSRPLFESFLFFFAMALLSLPRGIAVKSRPGASVSARGGGEAPRGAEDGVGVVVEREEGHLAHGERAHARMRQPQAVEGALAPLAERSRDRRGGLVEVGERALPFLGGLPLGRQRRGGVGAGLQARG